LDPSYDVRSNQKLVVILKSLLDDDFEIGLHGSYESAVNLQLLEKEKCLLENTLEVQVGKVRQHWLRYRESVTPFLHNQLFQYDSTVGWNDSIGFRSGCASRYRPYNHREQKPFDYQVTPQVIMDSTLFDYGAGRKNLLIAEAMQLLEDVKSLGNTCITISWHQRSCSRDYRWHKTYEQILLNLGGASESIPSTAERRGSPSCLRAAV
jgi:hypothetical protein